MKAHAFDLQASEDPKKRSKMNLHKARFVPRPHCQSRTSLTDHTKRANNTKETIQDIQISTVFIYHNASIMTIEQARTNSKLMCKAEFNNARY